MSNKLQFPDKADIDSSLYYRAASSPLVTSDTAHGYWLGQRWVNTITLQEYRCDNPANGAAVWTALESATPAGSALDGLTPAADKVPYFTGPTTAALASLTSFGRSVIGCVDAAALIVVLGLGTMATQNANAVAITGGAIDGTAIGATTPSTVKATDYAGTGKITSTSVASGVLGIGTATPLRAVHFSIADATTKTILALENTDTTDTNGLVYSYRTTTTGAGAAVFTELAAIQVAFTTHDHATRASTMTFYTSVAGTLAARMTIGATGDVAFAGAISTTNLTNSGITVGQIPYSGPANLMTGSPYLTFAGTSLTIGDGTTGTGISFNGAAATVRDFVYRTAGLARWILRCENTAESGADVGSDFLISSRHDDGTSIDNPISIARVSGGNITFTRPLSSNAAITATGACSFGATATVSTLAGEWKFGNNVAAYDTAQTAPVMYATANTGGAYPFLGSGNLVISPRISGASRDVIFATGATPTATLIVTGTNRVLIATTTDNGVNTLQITGSLITSTTATIGTNLTISNGSYTQTITDAITNTFTNLITLNHASSGTVAASFGSRILWNLTDDGGTNRNAVAINAFWTSAVAGSQTSSLSIATSNLGGGLTTRVTFAPAGMTLVGADAATNTQSVVASFQHSTSGTAANGFGTTLGIVGVDDGGTQRTMSNITAQWTVAASATRTSSLSLTLINSAAAVTAVTFAPTTATWLDAMNFVFGTGTGVKLGTATTQKIGFWNAAPVIQPTATTAAGAAVVTTGSALASYGYTQAQADDIVAQLNKTTARVNDLATKLQTIGITA